MWKRSWQRQNGYLRGPCQVILVPCLLFPDTLNSIRGSYRHVGTQSIVVGVEYSLGPQFLQFLNNKEPNSATIPPWKLCPFLILVWIMGFSTGMLFKKWVPNIDLNAGTELPWYPLEVRKSSTHCDLWLTHSQTFRTGRDPEIMWPKTPIDLRLPVNWDLKYEVTPESHAALYSGILFPLPDSSFLLPTQQLQ